KMLSIAVDRPAVFGDHFCIWMLATWATCGIIKREAQPYNEDAAMTVITPDRFLRALQQTPVILNGILHGVTQEQAATLRDPNPSASGGAGWTTTEVVCHLRDFETIFYERALLLLKEDRPEIPTFDADQLA